MQRWELWVHCRQGGGAQRGAACHRGGGGRQLPLLLCWIQLAAYLRQLHLLRRCIQLADCLVDFGTPAPCTGRRTAESAAGAAEEGSVVRPRVWLGACAVDVATGQMLVGQWLDDDMRSQVRPARSPWGEPQMRQILRALSWLGN